MSLEHSNNLELCPLGNHVAHVEHLQKGVRVGCPECGLWLWRPDVEEAFKDWNNRLQLHSPDREKLGKVMELLNRIKMRHAEEHDPDEFEAGEALALLDSLYTQGQQVKTAGWLSKDYIEHVLATYVLKRRGLESEERIALESLCDMALHALSAQQPDTEAELLALAAEAFQELNVCYRLGKRPTEKLFAKLEKSEKALAAYRDKHKKGE